MALIDTIAAYWAMDEASGTAIDAHALNDLTDNNTVARVSGKINNAASFVAANSEYFSSADNADLSIGTGTSFTISLWVYFPSTVAGTQILVSKGPSAGAASQEYQVYLSTGSFAFAMGNGTVGDVVVGDTQPSVGFWYHVLVWFDFALLQMGIQINNGTRSVITVTHGSYNTTDEMTLGRWSSFNGGYATAYLDEVGLWKRALTSTESMHLYNGGAGFPYPFTEMRAGFTSLLAFWMGGAGMDPSEVAPVGFHSLLGFWVGGAGTTPGEPVDIVYGTLKPIWHGRGRRR